MSVISVYEAKSLAYVFADNLPASFRNTPKRGQWLDLIAKECGFRDWNAMAQLAPDQAPDLAPGGWHSLFFTAALVETPEGSCFRMITTREFEIAHLENGWPQRLADALSEITTLRSSSLAYGREDGLRTLEDVWPTPKVISLKDMPRTKHEVVRLPPALIFDALSGTRIAVWFAEARYSEAKRASDNEPVPYYRFEGAFRTWGPEAPVDQLLARLTGHARTRRTCLYVPEVPNTDDSKHVPVIATEGMSAGAVVSKWPALPYEEAFLLAMERNREAGVSVTDMRDIASQYSMYEPKEEDEVSDFPGSYD